MEPENKRTHLGFIQQVINRMGNNSFFIKGWSITLLTAIFALSEKNIPQNYSYIGLSLFPILVFWVLDSYYLRQERLFRKLYDNVSKGKIKNFSMNTKCYEKEIKGIFKTMCSQTISMFYIMLIVCLIIYSFLLY